MDRQTNARTMAPNAARNAWRGYVDKGMVAAAFLAILWFLSAGLGPQTPNGYETASVNAVKPAAPVAAKAP
jgi:hypothetical protein